MSDKIKIRDVEGGIDGEKLKGCYFVPAEDGSGTFDFYDKKIGDHNKPLKTGITSGTKFEFILPDHGDLPWQIDVKSITDEKAHGEWFAGLQKIRDQVSDDEGSGTFQAQAGGAMVPEDTAYSATA